jgi:Ca-activated chloride channel family protein
MRENHRRLVAAATLLVFLAACSMAPGDSGGAPAGQPAPAATPSVHLGPPEAKGSAAPGLKEMAKREGALDGLRAASEAPSTEQYAPIAENPFLRVSHNPLSTFSIDVDTAAYAVVRRHLSEGRLPPAGAVRIEELINYFPYDYAPPEGDTPFAARIASTTCPWKPEHRLVRIGLKGRTFPEGERPASNLVFLVDVSGSMQPANKLPLLVRSFKLLAERLEPTDRVAIVVYAGSSGLVLPSTTGDRKQEILDALDRLSAGGSTNGGAGIRLAYATAEQHFVKGGTNRVILATDGDFNVGTTSNDELVRLVEEKAKSGVFLTVLGFGTGNYKDDRLESLADRGNGNYAYVDSIAEGQKVLVEQAGGTLHTIAKDVKIQVEFNPARAAGWRLLGYENRLLRSQDFADDRKDAGEIGAGHSVTALYEVVPAGVPVPSPEEPGLKYQEVKETAGAAGSELLTVKLRWKAPDGDVSRLAEFPHVDGGLGFADADPEFRFAASVACFGMVLRGSAHRASATYDTALELAAGALGADPQGRRHEYLALVAKARALASAKESGTK